MSVYSGFQLRNHTITTNNTEQWLFRYHFFKKAFVAAWDAYIPTYVYDSEQKSPETEEH